MKYILSEKQLKLYHGTRKEGNPLTKFEIKLLKLIHEEKKEFRTKDALLKRIKDILPFLNISPLAATYYYELYRANYRKDGDFENITSSNFYDPKRGQGKTTRNTNALEYVAALLPFRGSNLSAFWGKDGRGVPIYIVNSYNWYPIYIYRDDKWYEVTERFSPATGRQMWNVRPKKRSEDLENEIYFLSKKEMENLLRGATHAEIMKQKKENLLGSGEKIKKSRQTRFTAYADGPITVKYKVRDVEENNGEIIIKVDVVDVISKRNPELNYLKNEIPSLNKTWVENRISRELNFKYKDFVGMADDYYYSDNPTPLNFKYEFKHLKPN